MCAASLAAAVVLGMRLMPARADCVGASSPEELLRQLTAAPYSKRVRPGSEGDATEVATQLHVESLVEVDEKTSTVVMSGYWRIAWTDQRLNFTSVGDGGCFDELTFTGDLATPLLSDDVWVPDLYFNTAKEEHYGSNFLSVGGFGPGSVYVSVRFQHRFVCTFDFSMIPWDAHVCQIGLMSYTENASKVTLTAKDGVGIVLEGDGLWMPPWRSTSVDWGLQKRTYGTGDAVSQYDFLRLDVIIERAAGYHLRNDVLYAVLFVAMSWAGFFVDRHAAPARVGICLLPVLTMLNHIKFTQASMPPIATDTWLTSFLLVSLVYNTIAVFEYGLVAYLLFREQRRAERLQILRTLSEQVREREESARSRPPRPPEDIPSAASDEDGQVKAESSESSLPVIPCSSLVERPPTPVTCGFTESGLLPMQRRTLQGSLRLFDPHGDGAVTRTGMRSGLRRFNVYYTEEQVTEIFGQLGVDEGGTMPRHKILTYLRRQPKATPTLDKGFLDDPPSLVLDRVMRYTFFTSYLLVLLVMFLAVQSVRTALAGQEE